MRALRSRFPLLVSGICRVCGLTPSALVQAAAMNDAYSSSKVQLLLANLVAGAVGGSAAAALTQPLDVVKTRAQLGHHGRSTSVLQVST